MYHNSFYTMGGTIRVWSAQNDMDAVRGLFESADSRFSRFRPDSELSQLNRQANRWIPVSAEMWDMIAVALRLSAETNDLFNPFLQVKRMGRLVDDLLLLSRLDAKRLMAGTEEIDAVRVLRILHREYAVKAEAMQVTLNIHLPAK